MFLCLNIFHSVCVRGIIKNTSIHNIECIDVLNVVLMNINTQELVFKMHLNHL